MSIISQDDTELSGELREGQLQIVEVGAFDRSEDDGVSSEIRIDEDDGTTKYVQVMDSNVKGLMHLDFVNLTLVRCGDGENSYRLVTNEEKADSGEEFIVPDNDVTSVTCVIQTSDGEEQDGSEYVMVEAEESEDNNESYVMIDDQLYSRSEFDKKCIGVKQKKHQGNIVKKEAQSKPQTTLELLERAKALRKVKMLLKESLLPQRGRGRRRKHYFPDPQELLVSPKFKLFLYSCKQCQFKCNAIKELTAHRSSAHGPAGARPLRCGRCPARGGSYQQLLRHVQDNHATDIESTSSETEPALMCSACGFETRQQSQLAEHVLKVHGGE